ncbi:tape measure protein [Siphonobacter curvatus]|uniref:Tape measure protein n=1 Tax=Siphonobacter curvatus TaxID=2094562 RepID=A0A2S7IN59_9BACT|nr:tape measure protein [Siphonobacter curvatus]PQA59164.1 hypothetical protein C5O19_05775 [Siphonobacter curvatus]
MIQDEIKIQFTGEASGLNKTLSGVGKDVKQVTNAWAEAEKAAKDAEKAVVQLEKTGQKGTDAWKAAKAAAKDARTEAENARKSTELQNMTYGQLTNQVSKLKKELSALTPGTDAFVKKAKELGAAEKQLASVGKEVTNLKKGGEDLGSPSLWSKITGGIGGVKTAFMGFFALQVVQFFWDIGKAIFETTGKFEKYETTLTSMLGSQQKAKLAMQALKDIAAKTPFSLDEITDSYIKMTARGLRPSEQQLLRMGDAAAKMGKPFDSLMEAVLDVSNTERWNEIGIKVQKVGDKIKTNIGGSTRYFDATEQGAMEMAVAFGSTTDAMGLMEKQSATLSGRMSSIGDTFDQLYGLIGEKLKPVFTALLNVFSAYVEFLMEAVANSEPLVVVFDDLWGVVKQFFGVLMDLVYDLFPGLQGQSISATKYVQILAQVFSGVVIALKVLVGAIQLVVDSLAVMGETFGAVGKIIGMALTGDFDNISKVWDGVKTKVETTKKHLVSNFESIGATFKSAMVERPKADFEKGMLDTTKANEKGHKEITDTQKKELEKRQKEADKVRKAELKAQDESYKQQQEAHIATLATEIERERAKVDLKYELLKRQAEREKHAGSELTTALKEIEIQRKAELQEVETKHLQKIKDANDKALKQIAELEAETQINAIKDELLREEAKIEAKKQKRLAEVNDTLADEEYKAKLRKSIEDEATSEIEAKRAEHREKETKKAAEAAQKRLEIEKNIIEQQRQSENALFDWKEVQAQGNATKLAQIHKERVDRELVWTKEKLIAERDAELHKAELEVTDKEQLKILQKAISDRYRNEEDLAEANSAEKKKAIDRDLQETRAKQWAAGSDALQALMRGDVAAFADATSQIFQGEQQAWQKRLSAHMAGYEAIAGMAKQAVAFLNQLSQDRLQREIDNLNKETAAKIDAAETQKNAVIEGIRAEEQAELDRLRREYLATQMSAADVEAVEMALATAKQEVNAQYQTWMDSARAAGNKAELERLDTERREELKKVEDTVLANQMGAVQLRNNEQSLTEQKQTINAQYKAWMDEARAAGNAAELARLQNELAAEQSKLSSSVLANQMTADQLNAMEAQLADAKQATNARYKAWMDAARAAGNAAELARLENELAAELQKVDETIRGNQLGTATLQKMEQDLATKKTSINTKYNAEITKKTKETTNDIAKIQNDAAVKERELKREQWKQQKKADTATAIIQGSIAALKALASGFFPVNLVFAGIIAGMTAIQVAKINNQPEPTFAKGGFVARGGKHGSRYGEGGIALVDRSSGREVGEMEGDEAIISADQTEANWPLIQQMFKNARNPSMRRKPISGENRPMAFRDGGQLFESPYFKKEMYLFGSKKKKAERDAQKAQEQAEEQARLAQEQAEVEAAQYGGGGVEGGPDAEAAYAEAQQQGQQQLELLQGIIDVNAENGAKLDALAATVGSVRDAVNGNIGATYSVRDAVYGAVGDARNGIIAALSSFGG